MDKQMMSEKEIEMMRKSIEEDARRHGEQFGCFTSIAFTIIFALIIAALGVLLTYL